MKRCEFGHYYSDHLDNCPYCGVDAQGESNNAATTSGFDGDHETTSGFIEDETNFPTSQFVNTNEPGTIQIKNDNDFDQFEESGFTESNPDHEKTIIIDNSKDDSENDEKNIRPTRKLVGWLASYTLDEMGLDYRLFEGKNVIGSNVNCEVSVIQDKSVSGTHATILYRNNKFLIRDEFSTNGTFVNDKIVEEQAVVLKDGDVIKVGNTIFKFKTPLF